MKRHSTGFALRAWALTALAIFSGAALAQTPPSNDSIENAIAVGSVAAPGAVFTDTQPGISLATVDASDPMITCKQQGPAAGATSPAAFNLPQGQMAQTVWYVYTTGASTEYVNLRAMEATNNLAPGFFDPVMAVWSGTKGALRMVTGGCNDDGVPNGTNTGSNTGSNVFNNYSRIVGLRLQPNTQYYIEIAFNPGNGPATSQTLRFDMNAASVLTVTAGTNVAATDDPVPLVAPASGLGPWQPCTAALAASQPCTIREAIEEAFIIGDASYVAPRSTGSELTGPLGTPIPGAVVLIPAGTYAMSAYATTTLDPTTNPVGGNYNVGGGDFDVNGSMGIYGAGMGSTIINAPPNDRVFDLQAAITYTAATAPSTIGIVSSWTRGSRVDVILADMTLVGNNTTSAPSYSGSFNGPGGLVDDANHANGFHAIERLEFKNGFTRADGGAAAFGAKVQIRDSVFTGNTAMNNTPPTPDNTGRGGALTIGGTGTGLANFYEVSGSTFTGNHSSAENTNNYSLLYGGGAILVGGGYLALTNSTISGNSANGYGGGIEIEAGGSGSIADIRSTTIANNIADVNGNGVGAAGGGIYFDSPTSKNVAPLPSSGVITNSIIAGNSVGSGGAASLADCADTTFPVGAPQVAVTASYSLIENGGSGVCAFAGVGNVIGVDAMLAPLADNGGAASVHPLTHALLAGSPAVDAGDPAGCTSHFGDQLVDDERGTGFARSSGLRCDMGAFELTAIANAPGAPLLSSASDSGDSNSDGITNITKPTFTGTCAASGDSVTLTENGSALGTSTCNGTNYSITLTTALIQGVHAIAAFESNANGPSPRSAGTNVTIDLTGPSITLDSTPPAWEDGSDGFDEFVFTVGEGRLPTAQCTMDGATVADDGCTSGDATYFNLSAGSHTFAVNATDVAGNVTTQTYTWQIGSPTAAKPSLTSDTGTSNSDGITNADPLVFAESCTTGDSIQLYDGGNALGSAATCASGSASISVSGVSEGAHTITAVATRGGHASAPSASLSVLVDRTAPVLTIDSAPAMTMVSSSATFTFHTDDGSATQCQLDGAASVACTSPLTYNGLALGQHTFVVSSTDVAGNVAVPQTSTWTVIQPNASGAPMLAPASDTGRLNSDGVTNAIDTVFAGACTDGDTIQLFDGSNAVGASVTCGAQSSGVYNITLSNLTEGSHAIAMTATRNGIASPMSAAATIVIDRTAPAAPAIGNATAADLTATVSGLAEPASIVEVRDGTEPVCSATADTNANWSCTGELAGSGTRSLTATATDIAGNTSAASPAVDTNTSGDDRIFRDGFED